MTPDEARKLADDALAAMRRGDAQAAVAPLEALTGTGRASADVWMLLARAHRQLGAGDAVDRALERVLAIDPDHLRGLLLHGERLAERGEHRAALSFRLRALALARSSAAAVPADLHPALEAAQAAAEASRAEQAGYLDRRIAEAGRPPDEVGPRFAEALAILKGETQPYFQQPTSFFYPRLPHVPFFERDRFEWIEAFEAAAPAIRAELEEVLRAGAGMRPYVQQEKNRPRAVHELLEDARWSAWDLIKDGEPVEEHAARCPKTMAALGQVPLCRVRGRSPMALFSVLRPKTRISAHHGLLNTRLICHLPLIVPEGCGLRVGNETRSWRFGETLIFDDSIEHEAWNDSDETRVVLIFEIWRPELDEAERGALTAMFEAIEDYDARA